MCQKAEAIGPLIRKSSITLERHYAPGIRLTRSSPSLLPRSLPLKRKLGAPRRNLKKVVRLPAFSLRPSLNPCTSERARRACPERISEVDASRSAKESRPPRPRRRKSRGVIEADRERVQKEKDRSESERVSSALVAPGHRPRRSEPLQAGFGPRTRSDGTAIFPNCGHAPANENATSRRERRA